MDDLPRGKATDNELLLWIVNQLIPNVALVDEVFLCILKQSIANPKFDPMTKGYVDSYYAFFFVLFFPLCP